MLTELIHKQMHCMLGMSTPMALPRNVCSLEATMSHLAQGLVHTARATMEAGLAQIPIQKVW